MSRPLKPETLCDGEMLEALEIELQKALDNIADERTEAEKTREIILKIKIKPDEERGLADVIVEVSSKLAPQIPLETSILVTSLNGKTTGSEIS